MPKPVPMPVWEVMFRIGVTIAGSVATLSVIPPAARLMVTAVGDDRPVTEYAEATKVPIARLLLLLTLIPIAEVLPAMVSIMFVSDDKVTAPPALKPRELALSPPLSWMILLPLKNAIVVPTILALR